MSDEVIGIKKGERCATISVNSTPIRDFNKEIVAAVAVFDDITTEKKTERERLALLTELDGALRARDQVLDAVTHDLKNPLTAMMLRAQLIQKSQATKEELQQIQSQAKMILSAGERMRELIHSILDISRKEAGQYEIHPRRELAEKLISDAVELHRAEAEKKEFNYPIYAATAPGSFFATIRRFSVFFPI